MISGIGDVTERRRARHRAFSQILTIQAAIKLARIPTSKESLLCWVELVKRRCVV